MQRVKGPQRREGVQRALERELAELKRRLPYQEALIVCWKPQADMGISGEVKGFTIYVYEDNLEEAVRTLKHEYVDCLVTRKLVLPFITMVNAFIKLREQEIYSEKERVVTALSDLI